MYFSKGKAQSAQPSLTDLNHQSHSSHFVAVASHQSTSTSAANLQKNSFNFNIYYASDKTSIASTGAGGGVGGGGGGGGGGPSHLHDNNITTSILGKSQLDAAAAAAAVTTHHSQTTTNGMMLTNFHSPAGTVANSLNAQSQHSWGSAQSRSGSSRVTKNNKFQIVTTFPAVSFKTSQPLHSSTTVAATAFPRSVTRMKLIGFSGDPEFQIVRDSTLRMVAANDGLLHLKTDEIPTEVEYDQRLKQLKRSVSAFLPAYKAFKMSAGMLDGLHMQQQSPSVGQLAAQAAVQLAAAAQGIVYSKRPYYFLTEKNEPIFSLKQLQDRLSLKDKAAAKRMMMIEGQDHLRMPAGGGGQMIQQQQQQLRAAIHSSGFFSAAVTGGGTVTGTTSNSSLTTTKTLNCLNKQSLYVQPTTQSNFIFDEMSEKRIVYITLKTQAKTSQLPSLTQTLTQTNQNIPSFSNTPTSLPSLTNIDGLDPSTTAMTYNNGDQFQLTIELFPLIAPKACENFLKLCEGYITSDGKYLSFRNTSAVRFKKNGFIQLGLSKPGLSIFPGGYFEDESFAVPHDRSGVLGYCNRGTPHTNSSQFYITLAAMPSFDKKMVAFGRVTAGLKHLEKINKMIARVNSEIPPFNVILCDSGVLQSRPSTNMSRKSAVSLTKHLNGGGGSSNGIGSLQFDSILQDVGLIADEVKEEPFRPELAEIFTYKGEKAAKFQTFEEYVLGEAEKHKEVAAAEYLSLMLALQSIAHACQEILLTCAFRYKTIEELQAAMKETFVSQLSECQSVALLYDLTDDQVYLESNYGKYVVAFTSIDVNHLMDTSTCGSLFLIFRKTTTSFRPAKRSDLLQSGETISGAGYIVYGQSTQIVFHTGYRLNGFTYDNESNIFVLTHPRIKASKRSGILSCDESEVVDAGGNIAKFVMRKKIAKDGYIGRYVGSRVADFHRTLLYGGVLIYPKKEVNIYEAFVFSYIIDKAWDRSGSGHDGQILIKKPLECTERVQLYLGNSAEVLEIDNLYLSIRRKNSLFKIHELPSQKTIKSQYSIQKSAVHSPKKAVA